MFILTKVGMTMLISAIKDCVGSRMRTLGSVSVGSRRRNAVLHSLKMVPVFAILLFLFCASPVEPRMTDAKEQRTVIKFLVSMGATPIQCWQKLREGCGASTLSKNTVRVWHKRFSQGEQSTKDRARSGRPRTARNAEMIQRVSDIVTADRRVKVRDIAEQLPIGKTSVHKILKKDMSLTKVSPKLVPRLLTDEQKRFRMRMCQLNLDSLKQDSDFIHKFVTRDESWVSVFEPELKKNASQWQPKGQAHLRPQKAIRQRSAKKAMITVFFTTSGVVLAEFLPPGETVCAENYCDLLRRLKENLRRKRPDMWVGRKFFLHHDNVPPHTAVLTLAFIGSSDIEMVPHLPYSPDLAPSDFFLFPRLKNEVRGHRFQNVRDMKTGILRALRTIPPAHFEEALMSLPVRWMKCISAEGEYFEGRHLHVDPGDFDLVFMSGSEETSDDSSEEDP